MRALIKKDFYICYCTSPVWPIMMLIYIAVGVLTDQTFFLGFSAFMPALLVNSTISADEAIKWEPFALALPVSRRELVYSRYLFGLLNLLMMGVFVLVCGALGYLLGVENILQRMMIVPFLAAGGLLMLALNIPFEIRFGGTKGRIASMLCTVAVFAAVGSISVFLTIQDGGWAELLQRLTRTKPVLMLATAVILSMVLSVYLSIRFEENKNY